MDETPHSLGVIQVPTFNVKGYNKQQQHSVIRGAQTVHCTCPPQHSKMRLRHSGRTPGRVGGGMFLFAHSTKSTGRMHLTELRLY